MFDGLKRYIRRLANSGLAVSMSPPARCTKLLQGLLLCVVYPLDSVIIPAACFQVLLCPWK